MAIAKTTGETTLRVKGSVDFVCDENTEWTLDGEMSVTVARTGRGLLIDFYVVGNDEGSPSTNLRAQVSASDFGELLGFERAVEALTQDAEACSF